MSAGDRRFPYPNDWLPSSKILDEAVYALREDKRYDTKHDIPYAGGCSEDGGCIYRDKGIDLVFTFGRRKVDVTDGLILHESVEKALKLFAPHMIYELRHQIALAAEKTWCDSRKIPWGSYNRQWDAQFKVIEARPSYPDTPKKFDWSPLVDEKDQATIKKIVGGMQ